MVLQPLQRLGQRRDVQTLTRDENDDNDDHVDETDACAKGVADWASDNTSDWDNDGCQDATEDEDDDNDGVNDVNATGDVLDLRPKTPVNATDVNDVGCAAIERDTDLDGVNDLQDHCEGTPTGLAVNDVGCADIDGDGVFANVDQCANSPPRWSVDAVGCAVVQKSGQLDVGEQPPMDDAGRPPIQLSDVERDLQFQQPLDRARCLLFHVQVHRQQRRQQRSHMGTEPREVHRNLPANTHLFYGSFDNSYHNDVIQQRNAVLAGLTTSEEGIGTIAFTTLTWMPAIWAAVLVP